MLVQLTPYPSHTSHLHTAHLTTSHPTHLTPHTSRPHTSHPTHHTPHTPHTSQPTHLTPSHRTPHALTPHTPHTSHPAHRTPPHPVTLLNVLPWAATSPTPTTTTISPTTRYVHVRSSHVNTQLGVGRNWWFIYVGPLLNAQFEFACLSS